MAGWKGWGGNGRQEHKRQVMWCAWTDPSAANMPCCCSCRSLCGRVVGRVDG